MYINIRVYKVTEVNRHEYYECICLHDETIAQTDSLEVLTELVQQKVGELIVNGHTPSIDLFPYHQIISSSLHAGKKDTIKIHPHDLEQTAFTLASKMKLCEKFSEDEIHSFWQYYSCNGHKTYSHMKDNIQGKWMNY